MYFFYFFYGFRCNLCRCVCMLNVLAHILLRRDRIFFFRLLSCYKCSRFVFARLIFTQLHKPLQFSTGPFTEYTHWKQTVFYLRQPITISKGESIKGKITVKPNDKVRRLPTQGEGRSRERCFVCWREDSVNSLQTSHRRRP